MKSEELKHPWVTVRELAEWLKSQDPDHSVGIDENELMLVNLDTGAYFVVGGIPIAKPKSESKPAICGFSEAWVGRCKLPPLPGGCRCEKHEGWVCESCGAPATHTCDETFAFVCGARLCDNCEHEIQPDGTNGFVYKHCRKDQQKHKPWCSQKTVEKKSDGEKHD